MWKDNIFSVAHFMRFRRISSNRAIAGAVCKRENIYMKTHRTFAVFRLNTPFVRWHFVDANDFVRNSNAKHLFILSLDKKKSIVYFIILLLYGICGHKWRDHSDSFDSLPSCQTNRRV